MRTMFAAALTILAGCASAPAAPADPQTAFMARLTALCGKAFAGRLVTSDAADADMQGKPMIMHVRACTANRIEIPFHIGGIGPDGGWDRSRTWVISKTDSGLRLKHDHRHADGSADALTMYGGDTAGSGTAEYQVFPVDGESIAMFIASDRRVSTANVWAVEVKPTRFAYELRRANRHFRVEFDVTQRVATPPAPWGW
jgi:hypothetical protein